MTVTEWTCAVLGIGGGLVALINLIGNRLARRDKVKDAAAEAAERRNDAAAQVEELRSETAAKLERVDGQIVSIKKELACQSKRIEANGQGTQAQLFNTINHLGNKYIGKGPYISSSDLRGILELWNGYKAQLGDVSELTDGPLNSYEYLCRVMEAVNELKIQQ